LIPIGWAFLFRYKFGDTARKKGLIRGKDGFPLILLLLCGRKENRSEATLEENHQGFLLRRSVKGTTTERGSLFRKALSFLDDGAFLLQRVFV
jgi:hypothetical protein